jgi:hypothetical protein
MGEPVHCVPNYSDGDERTGSRSVNSARG